MNESLTDELLGFDVEALDGTMGKVRDITGEELGQALVVKPGMFQKRHVIPATKVVSIDRPHHRVRVRMTKHEIKEAPVPVAPWTEPMERSLAERDWYSHGI